MYSLFTYDLLFHSREDSREFPSLITRSPNFAAPGELPMPYVSLIISDNKWCLGDFDVHKEHWYKALDFADFDLQFFESGHSSALTRIPVILESHCLSQDHV